MIIVYPKSIGIDHNTDFIPQMIDWQREQCSSNGNILTVD